MTNETNSIQKETDLYKISSQGADPHILVCCSDSPVLVPGDNDPSSMVKLEKGDRHYTPKYADMLIEHNTVGLVRLCQLKDDYLEKLEGQRQVRLGNRLSEEDERELRNSKRRPSFRAIGESDLSRAARRK